MSQIDPKNVIVLVRDSSNAVVRIGVCHWRQLRDVVRTDNADDEKRLKEIEAQVGRAMNAGVSPS